MDRRRRSSKVFRLFIAGAARLIARYYLHNPYYAKRIAHFYRSPSMFGRDLLNHAAYRLRLQRAPVLPSYITLEISSACNLKCPMCPQPERMRRPKGFMPFDTFRRVLDANPHLRRVGLTNWGETLLHPELGRLLAYAREKDVEVCLTTNATLLTAERAALLLDSEVMAVVFSLDGVGEGYEAVRGADYAKVLANIQRFLGMNAERGGRCYTEINCVVGAHNRAHHATLLKELAAIGVDNVNMQSCQLYDGGPGGEGPAGRRRSPVCPELYRALTVLAQGDVVPCCVDYDGMSRLGNVNEDPHIGTYFNGPAMRRLRTTDLRSDAAPVCCR